MEKKSFYIGFDFSINKPAWTMLCPDKTKLFRAFPLSLTKNSNKIYDELRSSSSNALKVISRNLPPMSELKNSSKKSLENTVRSLFLANSIMTSIKEDIQKFCSLEDAEIWMCSEGLSFGSSGNAALDLAYYKGVFMAKFLEEFKDSIKGIYTYAPITIKATAGCSKKDKAKSKTPMIDAFMAKESEDFTALHKYLAMQFSPLKKAKADGWIECVDDLVDSYWALNTMLLKEKL